MMGNLRSVIIHYVITSMACLSLLLPVLGWPEVYVGLSTRLVHPITKVQTDSHTCYQFDLRRGDIFLAKFVVSGTPDVVDIFLSDHDNFILYKTGRPFFHYGSTSGLAQRVITYSVAIPKSGSYYLVVDSKRASRQPTTVNLQAYLTGRQTVF